MKAVAPCLLAVTLAGCGSTRSLEPSAYANASCAELNAGIGSAATGISNAAIGRGKIDRFPVPFWVPGGAAAKEALKARATRSIETLRQREDALVATRGSRCG